MMLHRKNKSWSLLIAQQSLAVSRGLGVRSCFPSSATDFLCNLFWITSAISLSLGLLQSLKSLQVRSNSNWGLSSLQCNVIVTCYNANNKEMLCFLVIFTLFILHHIALGFFSPFNCSRI